MLEITNLVKLMKLIVKLFLTRLKKEITAQRTCNSAIGVALFLIKNDTNWTNNRDASHIYDIAVECD